MSALLAATTFLLLQLLCQVFVAEGSGCEPPSGYVTFPEYNATYKNHEEYATRAEARDRCVAEGADLAVITSVEQMKRIVDFTILDSKVFMHIGIHRSATTSPWVRVDNGQPVTSIPWRGLFNDENSNCAFIWRNDGGTFTNRDCDAFSPFICERSLAEDCPSPVVRQDEQGPSASKSDTEQKFAEK